MDTLSKISTFKKRVYAYWRETDLFPANSQFIVGFSGGPDSVFLLNALCAHPEIGPQSVFAAHLNHGWRPDAAEDAAWCATFAEQHGCGFELGHAQEFLVKKSGSREADARTQRQAFFERCAMKYDAASIALAHHADDQLETFFIRLTRGAELKGLCAMRPRSGKYVHALLPFHKAEILESLAEDGLSYRIDSTNTEPTYLRNRLREGIALLQKQDNRFVSNALRTIAQLTNADAFIDRLAQEKLEKMTIKVDALQGLLCEKWLAEDPYLQRRILAIFLCNAGARHTAHQGFYEEIIRFARGVKSKTHMLSPYWCLHKKGAALVVERIPDTTPQSP
jgi:tRNA(Ile)-lysidine synthetase-like protein